MVNLGRKITQTTDLAFYVLKKPADSNFSLCLWTPWHHVDISKYWNWLWQNDTHTNLLMNFLDKF